MSIPALFNLKEVPTRTLHSPSLVFQPHNTCSAPILHSPCANTAYAILISAQHAEAPSQLRHFLRILQFFFVQEEFHHPRAHSCDPSQQNILSHPLHVVILSKQRGLVQNLHCLLERRPQQWTLLTTVDPVS